LDDSKFHHFSHKVTQRRPSFEFRRARSFAQLRQTFLLMVIIHDQTGVNDTRNPTEKRKEKTQEKTTDAPSQQHGERWKHDTEKITQRLHDLPYKEKI
jgi:hypothetical protein